MGLLPLTSLFGCGPPIPKSGSAEPDRLAQFAVHE